MKGGEGKGRLGVKRLGRGWSKGSMGGWASRDGRPGRK